MSIVPTINAAIVQRLIASQFPDLARLPVRPVERDGWDNRTFRVGNELTARLPSGPSYVGQVRRELDYLPVVAAHVKLPIPEVIGLGSPNEEYPYEWTLRRWISGQMVDEAEVDKAQLAQDAAGFLRDLRGIDPNLGPAASFDSARRGLPLDQWSEQVEEALAQVGHRINESRARTLWREALDATVDSRVWFHGDFAETNLLASGGRLSAVIDFGIMGVGDPACDLVLAWTCLREPERGLFRQGLSIDDSEWARGIGWALWKALITVDHERWAPNSDAVLRELGVS